MLKTKKSIIAATIAAGLFFSASSNANSTSGSIYGQGDAGTEISYINKNTGLARTISIGSDGKYRFSNVQPGVYIVTNSKGEKSEVSVNVSQGVNVSFGDDIETISVVGSRFKAIDVSSAESSTVFSKHDIDTLPVARNSVDLALLTPGTLAGGDAFGRNLPSFGGASVAENGYYIDGFDVTDLRELLGFATLPYEAVAQTEVKRGGLNAEYGRSLGGIINTITRSGTNEWEFEAAAYYRPKSLRASSQNDVDFTGGGDSLNTFRSSDTINSLRYNATVAGPIIKDKLFVMVNVEGQKVETNDYQLSTSNNIEVTSPNYIAKLDWYINDDHRVGITYIDNEIEEDFTPYDNAEGLNNVGFHGTARESFTETEGGNVLIANYTGYLTDNFTMRLMYGELESRIAQQSPLFLDGGDCPRAFDTTGGRTFGQRLTIGCWNPSQSFVSASDVENKDERVGYKTDFEWDLGDHRVKFGYESQEYDSYAPGREYTGGVYYRYFEAHPNFDNVVNGVVLDEGTLAVRKIISDTESGKFSLENTAWYVEDTWQLNDNMVTYLSVRGETFENLDANGTTFLESDTLIAPRLGFTWDINGDSTEKFYATLGRYYIPVATNSNIRATRTQVGSTEFFLVDGFDTATGEPIGLGDVVGPSIFDSQVPNALTIADTELDPMHQDELIIGYERALNDEWTVGVKGMYRDIQSGMDDFCGHDGFTNWAADQGLTNFDPHTLSGCILINPGNDISIALARDGNNPNDLTVETISNDYFGLPEYKRSYYALEFTASKSFSNNWNMEASYVWSRSYGNAEGYVNSTLGQEDAGATQDFDHARFVDGSNGALPNDREHQIKIYGTYKLNDEISFSVNASATSGAPLSCNGFLPTDGFLEGDGTTAFDGPNFRQYAASSFYCNDENGESQLTHRGDEGRSPWLFNFDTNVAYVPGWADGKLTLQAQLFNIFNLGKGTTFDQTSDIERGGTARSDDFLTPVTFQAPRRVELIARYKF